MRLIIADAHVGQRPGDVEDMVAVVRRAAEEGFGEIVYLGDAFQYLIGMSKFWTEAVRRVMAAWDEARSAGLRVVLIEGNRDFFLDEAEVKDRVDWAGRRYQFVAASTSYRLDHGDRINLRDLQYQFWSRISKSALARLWARALPRSLAVRIVRTMEARLATTNQRFRYVIPEVALRRAARRAWDEGVDVIMWGHFHSRWSCADGDRLAMVVPAWLETTLAVAVRPDGGWEWVEKSLTPAGPLPTMG
jgi:UDP-2,3-diacylglucosamine pyrophosphatase LpxH